MQKEEKYNRIFLPHKMYSVLSDKNTKILYFYISILLYMLNFYISLKGVAVPSISLVKFCKFDEILTQCAHINLHLDATN